MPELNNVELQFLLLNDFWLSILVEEIEAYGTVLIGFYALEVVANEDRCGKHGRSAVYIEHCYVRTAT